MQPFAIRAFGYSVSDIKVILHIQVFPHGFSPQVSKETWESTSGNGGCQYSLPRDFQNFKLGFEERKVGNQSWQLSGLSSTSLQIAVIHGERTVLTTSNIKVRCEMLLLHFSLMDHYFLRIHQVLGEGYIHSLFSRKLLDIRALRNFNGKKSCLEIRPSQGLSVSISSTS